MSLVKDKKAAEWISFMLVKDPKIRPGFEELKKHPFFCDINWDDVFEKKYQPSFKPIEPGKKSIMNFDPEYTTEIAADSYADEECGSVDDFYFFESMKIPEY